MSRSPGSLTSCGSTMPPMIPPMAMPSWAPAGPKKPPTTAPTKVRAFLTPISAPHPVGLDPAPLPVRATRQAAFADGHHRRLVGSVDQRQEPRDDGIVSDEADVMGVDVAGKDGDVPYPGLGWRQRRPEARLQLLAQLVLLRISGVVPLVLDLDAGALEGADDQAQAVQMAARRSAAVHPRSADPGAREDDVRGSGDGPPVHCCSTSSIGTLVAPPWPADSRARGSWALTTVSVSGSPWKIGRAACRGRVSV